MKTPHKPLIGLTTYPGTDSHGWHTPALYVAAVQRAGGVPLMLPGCAADCAEDWLTAVDGVVLIGGGDINPQAFGGSHHPTIYNLSPERDAAELALMHALLKQPKPTLAICRGLQILNTALGGSLHVHLPDVVGETVPHRAPPREPVPHAIRIDPNSALAGLLGESTNTASWHHQAIDRLGEGLKAVAWAPDGVIEAVEMATFPDLVAVQWHPEITAAQDAGQQKLFEWLVIQAARHKHQSGRST